MSRNAPFPTAPNRRPRSPPPLDAPSYPNGLPPTQPLSISRPRPRSPSNGSISPASQAYASTQPLRPARSERRPRQAPSVTGYGGPPSSYNTPSSSSRVDANSSSTLNNGYGGAGRQSPLPGRYEQRTATSRDRSNTLNTQSSRRTEDDPYGGMDTVASSPSTDSPKALGAVIAAFQQAGTAARRKNTGGSEGLASDRELERQREKERRDKALQRDRKQRRQATGGIDAVLDDVEQEWADVIEDNFNPAPLALALLDESSLGRDIDSFRHTKQSLASTLKGSVDKNYQAFAQSVAHHANLLNSLTKAQAELTDARTQLIEARDALGNKRADLVQLWARGQTLDEMMRLLDEIERLKSVPETLESLISEKRLLHAAVLLVKSLKIISKPDMLDIGAVADLRSYLTTQEASLRDILVEELHIHLYLKTFWCDRRWSPYTPNQMSFTAPEFDKIPGSCDQAVPLSRLELYLNHLALRPSNESPAELFENINDASTRTAVLLTPSTSYLPSPNDSDAGANSELHNPESDSFTYIEMLLEALAVLGKLVGALDIVTQRMPMELFALVDSTVDEVSERSEFLRLTPRNGAGTAAAGTSSALTYVYIERRPGELASSLRLTALEASTKETDRETLRDLFWTLYSKLSAVLQGFRVTYEVSDRIGKRRDFKDTSGIKSGSLFPLLEIWIPLQNEVTSLLGDYLRDGDQMAISGRNPIASINEVLRSASQVREKIKASFRFGDTDAKISARLLRKQDDELYKVLKETVPGLVTAGPADGASAAPLSTAVPLDDRSSASSGHHHRLLITPDALHVTVLFQPTLAWLDSVNAAFPASLAVPITEAQSLLDDFVINIYLPQLEEKVQTLSQDIVSAPDAFHEDPGWKNLSTAPLIKAITNLVALVNSMCAMMRVTPFHHENYSRLILGIIMQFYQRCSDRFQSLTTRTPTMPGVVADPSQFHTPAAWAQRSDLVKCFLSLLSSSPDDRALRRSLCQDETRLELTALGGSLIKANDNLGSPRTLSSLANLYQSLVWLSAHLINLRKISEDPESPRSGDLVPLSAQSPLMPTLSSPRSDADGLSLPLSRAMVLRLDSLLKIYDQLAEIVLFTIRTDIRCRVFHHLQRGLREDLYHTDQEAQDPDLYVIELTAELAACDNAISTTLGDRERRFVFAGLGVLAESLLVSEARHVRSMNEAGAQKMLRNITAIRQCLKAIDVVDPADAEFQAARAYYSLYQLGPSRLLDVVRSQPRFSFEEYKVILSLQSAVDPMAADNLPPGAGGDFALHLIELQTICVE